MGPSAIGICAAVEQVRRGPWDEVVTMTQRTYPAAVQRAGGIALLLPPDDAIVEAPDPLLDRIDALILAGGVDIDPRSYDAVTHPATDGTWPERDRFEIALARRALERELPLLGICRGMEILNIARGGTLVQHLPEVVGHDGHRAQLGVFGEHEVRLEPGSLAAGAVGGEQAVVKSHHHQGIDELGVGINATGWCVDDDLVEAIELADHPGFALGVLWHAEEDGESRVIERLVKVARAEVGAR